MDRKRTFSTGYLLLALIVAWLFNDFVYKPLIIREAEVSYDVFIKNLNENNVGQVLLSSDRIIFTLKAMDEQQESAANVVAVNDPDLVDRLVKAGVPFSAQPQTKSLFSSLLGWFLPLLPLALLWYFLLKRMGGGMGSNWTVLV